MSEAAVGIHLYLADGSPGHGSPMKRCILCRKVKVRVVPTSALLLECPTFKQACYCMNDSCLAALAVKAPLKQLGALIKNR